MELKFRKKPIVIEAFQMTEERRASNADWPQWMHQAWQLDRKAPGSLYPTEEGTGDGRLSIGTLEGQHLVSWGDWIIQGVHGELYPCKPDIFAKTYEPAEASPASAPEALDWLETELSAISCRYHGDPSYDHDAYWMRGRVEKLLEEARKLFTAPTPPVSEERKDAERLNWLDEQGMIAIGHKGYGEYRYYAGDLFPAIRQVIDQARQEDKL